jgi:serine phosphatase RsbU (regulator of sigma subunit)
MSTSAAEARREDPHLVMPAAEGNALPVAPREASSENGPGSRRRPGRVAVAIAVVGAVLTAVASWGAARTDQSTEQRLLDGQTKQAAAVLATAIVVVQQPLEAVIAVARAAGPSGDRAAFEQYMAAYAGPDKAFQSASLWHRRGDRFDRLTDVGDEPAMGPDAPATQEQLRRAFDSKTTTVRLVTAGTRIVVVYMRADPATGWVVYAERAVPANRRARVDNNSAFNQIHYALYLGRDTRPQNLTTTDVDAATLPFHGVTARTTVPFGDTVLTLSTTPRDHLGSQFGRELPWLLLVTGLLLTAIATRTGQQLARGRQTAELDAATITTLYETTDALYGQQRDLFVSLQRALLPHMDPEIPNIEFAAEYVAGAHGLDIGGDWFSIVELNGGRFGFVVGDVSGRGIDAVAVMAQARFTIRAYLVDGDDPATVLTKCAEQFDIVVDGHMTTALVGVGDWRTGEVTLASAGHPPPVLLTGDGATFVDVTPGRPLGTGSERYDSTTLTMTPGATLFCFTDGLVERRGEDIDTGLDRLAATLVDASDRPVGEVVAHALRTLHHDDTADDIATLAIRWTAGR